MAEMAHCPSCGAELAAEDSFCHKCGRALTEPTQTAPSAAANEVQTRRTRRGHRGLLVALILLVAVALAGGLFVLFTRSTSPVPAAEQTRIQTLLAPYAYIPASLPKGFIYIDWKYTFLSSEVAGKLLTIDFAGPNGQIVWTSSRAFNPSATGWPGYGYGMTANESASIDGHLVYFSQGNHGSNAWTYYPIGTPAQPDYAAVGIWESNGISPAEAMQIVAHARPA